MAKKRDKAGDTKRAIDKMTKDLQKIIGEDFNHEELRQCFVDFATFMFKVEVWMLELWGEQQAEFKQVASRVFKEIKTCNDQDFKQAEKNFKAMEERIVDLEHKAARAEAMAAVCVLNMNAMKAALVSNSLIGRHSLQDGFKLIPKKITEFLRKFIGMKPKEWKVVMDKAVETI